MQEWLENAKLVCGSLSGGCFDEAKDVIKAMKYDLKPVPQDVIDVAQYHPDGCPECKSELITIQQITAVTVDLEKCTADLEPNPGAQQLTFICGEGCGWIDTKTMM